MAKAATPEFFAKAVRSSRRFYLDLAPPRRTPLAVVCGGYEECSTEYDISRTTFPYYSVELVVRGQGQLVLNGCEYQLQPGSVFAYGPGVAHRMTARRGSRLDKYFIDFIGIDAEHLLTEAGLPVGHTGHASPVAEVQLVLNELLRDGLRHSPHKQSLCDAWLRCLLLRIASSRGSANPCESDSHATYTRCLETIDKQVITLLSQQQLADACGVSPAYLCRLFRKFGKQTPYQYLTRARMNLAADKLLDESVSITEVADQLGFTDPFHFSRTFKKVYGVSPSAFRALRSQ